jgi:hypothetical protein
MIDGRFSRSLKVERCENGGMSVHVVAICDQPWFVVDGLADAAGVPEKRVVVREVLWMEGEKRPTRLTDELGLYWALLRSESPLADDLARWVFDDVVPSIRKSGRFRLFQEAKRLGVTLDYTDDQWEWLKLHPYLTDVIPLALAGFDSVQISQALGFNTPSGITVRKQLDKLRQLGFLPKSIVPRLKQLEARINSNRAT